MKDRQIEYINKIQDTLAWLVTRVKASNRANLTDVAVLAEGFFKQFLNILFDYHLDNINLNVHNAEGVDLISKKDKIIVQVSARIGKKKLDESLKNSDVRDYAGYHYYFLIISEKKPRVSEVYQPQNIYFDKTQDIWDISYLIEKASNIDISKLKDLSEMTQKYYEVESLEKKDNTKVQSRNINDECIGYCINFGMNSCRCFEVRKRKEIYLKEREPIAYGIRYNTSGAKRRNGTSSKRQQKAFLDEIINISQNSLTEIMKAGRFVRVFADTEYEELFSDKEDRDQFIEDYYQATGHYFNILTQKQTEDNMKALFPNIPDKTAIIDICSTCVYVVLKTERKYRSHQIKISTNDIKAKGGKGGKGAWDDNQIKKIKDYIKGQIENILKGLTATTAYIIKDECSFMEKMGYPLTQEGTDKHIKFAEYTRSNKAILYSKTDFEKTIDETYKDLNENIRKKFYGFKEGHIILESIFEFLEVEDIVPTNVPNILRSPLAYVFNVVLSGSTKPEHREYMLKANEFFSKVFHATVTSPNVTAMDTKSQESYQRHIKAIKNCDLLFVCNGDGYIGEQTRSDIYGATLLSKPIAYWHNPTNASYNPDEINYSTYIPHDVFEGLLDHYYPEGKDKYSREIKGCIIGSFRKHYSGIVKAIEEFSKSGIIILSPKKSVIINPEEDFVRLATDDDGKTEYEIQAQVFEHERNSNFVYVWNPDGYIGRTTCYEIGRIMERGTPIFYKEKPHDLPLEVPEEQILSVDELIVKLTKATAQEV